jgi:hypothetical protein
MRLFVAFDLPNAVRHALATLAQRLKPECRAARWVRPESMHVTLKFLGETDPQKLSEIRAALAPIRSAQPVAMDFRVLGFFPNEFKPRILWCGVRPLPISPNSPPRSKKRSSRSASPAKPARTLHTSHSRAWNQTMRWKIWCVRLTP